MGRPLALLLLGLALLLQACGGGPSTILGDVSLSGDLLQVGTRRVAPPLELRYTLGRPAAVTVAVQPAGGGAATTLRARVDRPAGSYYLRVDGTAATDTALSGPAPILMARALPDGAYTLVLTAEPAGGQQAEVKEIPFKIAGVPTTLPALENVQAFPDTISPNSDAVDDVAAITFRLPQTGTTSVLAQGLTGGRVPLLAPTPLAAGEHSVAFTGNDLFGQVLPDGPYTVTVQTADLAGNTLVARVPVTVTGGGTPSIALLAADFSPKQVMLGKTITVRMTVQNTGKVPLRTQGPDPGTTYTTNDSYSSIAGGQYVDRAGLWRVGVDWDGNAGGAAYRYPFRWGFGHTLAPGETVTIEGHVTILKQERQMWFFAGVLQEGVRIVLDRLAPTGIGVGF